MENIVTYTGECFSPFEPDVDNIHIEDIAHSLSLLCRANGHFDRFFSVAQHCINCAGEAKSRGYTARLQLACLVHDGSEAYISDITRPVKRYLPQYLEAEKRLSGVIYSKFLGDGLSNDEFKLVDKIDSDMLCHEFNTLSRNRNLIPICKHPLPQLMSEPSMAARDFLDVETEFLKVYYGIMHAARIQGR